MSDAINLLKGSKEKRFRAEKILRVMRRTSFLLLFLVGSVSIVFFFLNRQSPILSLKNDEATQIATLTTMRQKAVRLILAEKRLTDISGIFEKKAHLDSVINGVTGGIPTDISVQSLSLDGKKFTITVLSSSLVSANTLLDTITALVQKKKVFTKLTLDGLSMDPGKKYYVILFSGDLP